MAFWRRRPDRQVQPYVPPRRPVGTPDAIEAHLRPAVLVLMQRLVERDYQAVVAMTPQRLRLEEIAEAMSHTGEVFLTPQAEHLDFGYQIGTGPHAELFVPLMAAERVADLEVQLQVGPDGELVLWNILVP